MLIQYLGQCRAPKEGLIHGSGLLTLLVVVVVCSLRNGIVSFTLSQSPPAYCFGCPLCL